MVNQSPEYSRKTEDVTDTNQSNTNQTTVYICLRHYNEVIMSAIAPASRLFTQPFVQEQIKENIKALRHWTLWGQFTGDRWNPRTKGQ